MTKLRVIEPTELPVRHLPPDTYVEVGKLTKGAMFSVAAKAIKLQSMLCGAYTTTAHVDEALSMLAELVEQAGYVREGLK